MPVKLITHPPSVDAVYIFLSLVARRRPDPGSVLIANSDIIVQTLGKPGGKVSLLSLVGLAYVG